MRAQPKAKAVAALEQPKHANALSGFHPAVRTHIAHLTCCAPAAADLATAFPAMLFALVTGYATPHAREHAYHSILDGEPLRHAADQLGLPYWLRKLPPQAFRDRLGSLPNDRAFLDQVPQYIPSTFSATASWLARIIYANEACGSAFALWCAKHLRTKLPAWHDSGFRHLTAWAWFSEHPDTLSASFLRRPWHKRIGPSRAVEELVNWRRRLALSHALGDGLPNAWLMGGTVCGYDFVPLLTVDDFITESETMRNCLDRYGERMETGHVRVFSIRQAGRPVADVEVGPPRRGARMPRILQLKASANRSPSQAVSRAARTWLRIQDIDQLPNKPIGLSNSERTITQQRLWRPYLDHLPRAHRSDVARLVGLVDD